MLENLAVQGKLSKKAKYFLGETLGIASSVDESQLQATDYCANIQQNKWEF